MTYWSPLKNLPNWIATNAMCVTYLLSNFLMLMRMLEIVVLPARSTLGCSPSCPAFCFHSWRCASCNFRICYNPFPHYTTSFPFTHINLSHSTGHYHCERYLDSRTNLELGFSATWLLSKPHITELSH